MIKRYQYRIYPTKAQQAYFQKIFGCCRFVYNWGLDIKKSEYDKQKEEGVEKIKTPSGFDLSRKLTQLKKSEEYNWIAEVPAMCLIHALRHLDTAFQNFFRNIKAGREPGYPQFKSKHRSAKAFSFHQGYKVNQGEGWLTVPKTEGLVKAVFHRHFVGIPKTCTIIQEPSGKYFASIVVHDNETAPEMREANNLLGLDHGVKQNITLSNGQVFTIDLDFTKEEKRLLRYSRNLARKKKGSRNFAKDKIKLAKIHEKIRNKRKYEIENLVCQLAEYLIDADYDGVIIRKYDVKSMIKKKTPKENDKGGFDKNGREVQKRINKLITNASLGAVFTQILYKLEQNGLNVFPVDADDFRTTNKCNNCKTEKDNEIKINLKTRLFECKKCGYIEDVDYNAAKNLYNLFMQDFEKQEVAA